MNDIVDRIRASTTRSMGGSSCIFGSRDLGSLRNPELQHVSSSTIRLDRVQPQVPSHRTIFCNDREANLPVQFKGNSISTTKNNVLTCLPKGLFEQAGSQFALLMISVLSTTPMSPMSPITNVLPLSQVLLVSLVKEAFEDWKLLQNDKVINIIHIDLLQDQRWESVPWKKLQVGYIARG